MKMDLISTEKVTVTTQNANDNLAARWLNFVSDRTPSTVQTYNKAIKRWFKYLDDNDILNPNRDNVISYRNYLKNNVSPATGRLYLTAVKMFFRWLAAANLYANIADGVNGIKVDTSIHSKDALTADEGKKLLRGMTGKNEKALRDKAIVALMMACGLRTIEIVRLDIGDVEKRRGNFYLKVHGKARDGKSDKVLLPPQCKSLIDDYLKCRADISKNAPLFTSTARSNKGERLQTQSISRLAKKALRNAGFDSPTLTAHSLRHTAATLMLKSGATDAQVQQVLRHKSIVTTQIYRHDIDFYDNQATMYSACTLFDSFHHR